MEILASPVIPPADLGRPFIPSAYPAKALDIPMFMSTERLLEGQAPVRQGVSSPLFVYLVSVVTEGLALSSWVSGATRCWVPAVPEHKAPTPLSCSGVLLHRVRI